jgi:hypothetical protein
MSAAAKQHLTDDEELARRLQLEDLCHTDFVNRGDSSNQELRDMELARHYAKMESLADKPPLLERRSTFDDSIPSAYGHLDKFEDQHPTLDEGSYATGSTGQILGLESRAEALEQTPFADDSLDRKPAPSPPFERAHRRSSSLDDHLACVRKLQEEAFSDLEKRAAQNKKVAEDSDLELALRIQKMEENMGGSSSYLPSQFKTKQEEEDASLARFMEEGGESFSALSERSAGMRSSHNSSIKIVEDIDESMGSMGDFVMPSYGLGAALSFETKQEAEDARLARLMAEGGASIRGLEASAADERLARLMAEGGASISCLEAFEASDADERLARLMAAGGASISGLEALDADERLARFMAEGGASIRGLSDEGLMDLIAATDKKKQSMSPDLLSPSQGFGSGHHTKPLSPFRATRPPPSDPLSSGRDERLARFMANGGESIRGLSDEHLMNIWHPKSPRFSGTLPPILADPQLASQPPKSPRFSGALPPILADPQLASQPPQRSTGRPGNSANASTDDRRLDMADPPGVNLPTDAFLDVPTPLVKEKKGTIFKKLLGFGGRRSSQNEGDDKKLPPNAMKLPASIPPPPGGSMSVSSSTPGPLPHTLSMRRDSSLNMSFTGMNGAGRGLSSTCCKCHQAGGTQLMALERMYHAECFLCVSCNKVIDHSEPFAYSLDFQGEKHPHHRKCFAESFGIPCAVCRQVIPASPDGTVSYVKHPFFDTEQMCPKHAESPGRRCTGCHRFEPEDEPFADLDDAGRCLCYACCRSVVIDNTDAKPLWSRIIVFLEKSLKLPVWDTMRDIPILIVGHDALNDQMKRNDTSHGDSSQILTRGLCLTEHKNCNSFKLPSMRFDDSTLSFETTDLYDKGFEYYDVSNASKANPNATVFAILCLMGLPRDLTASILAHEATHAWIKLHPEYNVRKPVPPQVEEGCAQLVAMLFLNDGLDPPEPDPSKGDGPSDEKLRQYFRFSIETEDNEIYGDGYRKAAAAYSAIGINALLDYVVRHRDFPVTEGHTSN